MKTIFILLFAGIFSLTLCAGSAECAKTYKKKTKNNTVKLIEQVQVEQIDDTPTVQVTTLGYLYTRRAELRTSRDNAIALLVELEILITNVTVEAEKVVLNIDP